MLHVLSLSSSFHEGELIRATAAPRCWWQGTVPRCDWLPGYLSNDVCPSLGEGPHSPVNGSGLCNLPER